LKQQAQQLVVSSQAASDTDGEDPIAVHEILPDSPVSDDIIVPEGWTLNAEGIAKGTSEDVEVSIPAPMVITRRFTEVDDDAEHVGVAWPRDGTWHEQIVPRTTVVDTRTVLKLAAFGAPVTSNTAKEVVQFLADFEAHNLEMLPRALAARQHGWQGEGGHHGFLWGQELFRQEAPAARSMTDTTTAAGNLEVVFRGADEGDDQLADGYPNPCSRL
jgi:putative DNA primase/helicase